MRNKRVATRKPDTRVKKTNPTDARDRARQAAVERWAYAVGTMETLIGQAEGLDRELRRAGSPLAGMFNADELRYFAGRLGDACTDLANNPPIPANIPSPLAGLAAAK